MKSLKRNLVLTTVLGTAIMIGLSGSAHATPILSFGSNAVDNNTLTDASVTTGNTTGNTVGNTTGNTTGNTAGNVSLSTTNTSTNRVPVNNVDADKDLPQTGENDVYIVTAIGVAALAIGGVAYMKSRKYDM